MKRTFRVCLVVLLGLPHGSAVCRADDVRMPSPRTFGRSATIDKKVYLFGGGVATIDIFDTRDKSWSKLATDVPASNTLYGDQIDGKLYLLDVRTRRLVRVDPDKESTDALPPLPTPRVNCTAIACGGKLYVIGGYNEKIDARNSVAVYDPRTNEWSLGPPLPGYQTRDHFHCAAVLNGKLHVVGGLLKGNKDQPHWRLDGGRWTRLADAPLHALWKHGALNAVGDQLYLLCPMATLPNNRANPDKDAANFYRYDPKANRWQPLGRAPRDMPFVHIIPAAVGQTVFYFGGNNGTRDTTRVRWFDVNTAKWN